MQAYGRVKRGNKVHPHNECGICSEQTIIKAKARQKAKHDIREEINGKEKSQET